MMVQKILFFENYLKENTLPNTNLLIYPIKNINIWEFYCEADYILFIYYLWSSQIAKSNVDLELTNSVIV